MIQCIQHLLKCIRNNLARKGNLAMFLGLKLSNDFAREGSHFNIEIVKQHHEKLVDKLLSTAHFFRIFYDPIGFGNPKAQPILILISHELA